MREKLLVALYFLAAAIFLSWPLTAHLDGFLLISWYKNLSHSDTVQHIEHLQVSREHLSRGINPLIVDQADVAQTYIFSGVILTKTLGMDDIVFHNIYFLATVFMSGLFMYLLAVELFRDRLSGLFCGSLYMSSNYFMYAYVWGHTNTMQIQWIPLIFLFLERTLKRAKTTDALLLGLSLALQIYSCSQYTVYLSFIIPVYLLLRIQVWVKHMRNRHFWTNIALALVVAVVVSAPYLNLKLKYYADKRTVQDNMVDYWRLSSLKQLFMPNEKIYLGYLQLILAMTGLAIAFKSAKYRNGISFGILGLIVLFLMIGPASVLAPYYWLHKLWPFVDNFRVPRRLFPFLLICTSVLSAVAISKMRDIEFLQKKRAYIAALILILAVIVQVSTSVWYVGRHIYFQ
ncbi:MAG: hypothetical protein ABIF10_07700 [Candidatus Woesearchaeota archaeon]